MWCFMNPGRAAAIPCRPRGHRQAGTYAAIVDDYIENCRPHVNEERRWFRGRSLEETIKYAGLAKIPDGDCQPQICKRHPHQYRLKGAVLAAGERRLQACAAQLRRCRSFAELHEVIKKQIGVMPGIGPLTVYDVANTIGAHLRLEPKLVYLHAGTAAGAKALGLDYRRETLDPAELPAEFRRLRPREVEDCLCMYKDEFAAARRKQGRGNCMKRLTR
jgi:hypothetical protein